MVIYLDNAATTKIRDEVFDEMLPFLKGYYGNASSSYQIGIMSREAINEARKKIARELNCNKDEIFFTSCGSESNNWVLRGVDFKGLRYDKKHIITSKIEHNSVLDTCKELEDSRCEITYINVDENGFINLKELENSIKPNTVLISIMFANNEIGTIQPIKEIGEIAKRHNVYFHTDAVQAVGSCKINVKELNIDFLSLSGHKLYAPKGIGAIYIKNGLNVKRYLSGGHQERNMRAGTENVAYIVGLGKAIELAYKELKDNNNKTLKLRNKTIEEIEKRIPNCKLNGDKNKRLPNNIHYTFDGVDCETLLFLLDIEGICVSTGSACNSEDVNMSHVLQALNGNTTNNNIRITLGKYNTEEEINQFLDILEKNIYFLRN